MTKARASKDAAGTTWKDAVTHTIEAGGVDFAYRELGPRGGPPLVFLRHLGAVLDDWDPRVIDGIAARRHVITFGFSLGGGVAEVIALEYPDLVRRLVLAGTGPAGGGGIDKITRMAIRAQLKAIRAAGRQAPTTSAGSTSRSWWPTATTT